MRKHISKIAVLAVSIVAFTGAFFLSCGDKNNGSLSPVTLENPVGLTLSGRELIWQDVDGANGYVIEINGVEYQTQENTYAFADGIFGAISARVKAVNGKSESEYSVIEQDVLQWKLPTPTGLKRDGETLVWDDVAFAQGYIVSVDGVQYFSEENVCEIFVTEENEVRVLARGNVSGSLISSEFSAPLKFPVILATPTNFRFENQTTLVWDSVEFATGYTVFCNGEEYDSVSENCFEIPSALLDADIAELQIRAESETDIPSEKSEIISVGKVSERNPKEISSLSDLMEIGETGYYKLTADISLSSLSRVWQIESFKGSLDGNGFKIKGLNTALFKTLNGAKVKNLTIENSVISTTLKEDGEALGALVNTAINSEIIGCKVTAKMTVLSQNGVGFVGGIAGVSTGTKMTDVKFVGEITASYCVTGGFIGKVCNPNTAVEISRCSTEAKIALTGGEKTYCGGFIGLFIDNALTVKMCKAAVEITANAAYCGGFVGYFGSGKTVDCYSFGGVKNTNETIAHVGGFIGRTEGYNVEVTRCISMAVVAAMQGEQIRTGAFVGVTVGGSYANVYKNCYYDKTLAPIDRIGNPSVGRGDGITGKTTEELKTLEYRNGYLETVWALGVEIPALRFEK